MVHVGRNAGTVAAVGLAMAGCAFSFLFFRLFFFSLGSCLAISDS